MKAYAKIAFNLPDDISETIIFNSAFILLLKSLDTYICIYRSFFTNFHAITQRNINQFLSDPLIDLSDTFVLTSNGIKLEMNSFEIIYKNLFPDVFDAIYNSDKQ